MFMSRLTGLLKSIRIMIIMVTYYLVIITVIIKKVLSYLTKRGILIDLLSKQMITIMVENIMLLKETLSTE